MKNRFAILVLAYISLVSGVPSARAQSVSSGLPLDIGAISAELNNLIPASLSKALIETIAYYSDYRSYQGSDGLGATVDFGIEATLVKIPDSLGNALTEFGLSDASAQLKALPGLPIAKLHLHKRFSPAIELGLALFYLSKYSMIGYGLSWSFFRPEEGPWLGLRLSQNHTNLGYFKTRTISGRLVLSKPLVFSEPYMGIGYTSATGSLEINIQLPAPLDTETLTLTSSATSQAFSGFCGILFNIVGLRISLEGSYHQLGMHALGTKIGFAF